MILCMFQGPPLPYLSCSALLELQPPIKSSSRVKLDFAHEVHQIVHWQLGWRFNPRVVLSLNKMLNPELLPPGRPAPSARKFVKSFKKQKKGCLRWSPITNYFPNWALNITFLKLKAWSGAVFVYKATVKLQFYRRLLSSSKTFSLMYVFSLLIWPQPQPPTTLTSGLHFQFCS